MEPQESNLNEGLTKNALEHLITPMISVDEYESKISDKRVIVVGFFVGEEDPATDLSNFIDRSNLPILDTEVSPAPTPEGYFMVFVEIQRDDQFPEVLMDLIDQIENLCDVDSWTFQCPHHSNEPIDLNAENLRKFLILDQEEVLELPKDGDESSTDVPEPTKGSDEISEAEFWKSAAVGSVLIEGDTLILESWGTKDRFRIVNGDDSAITINPDCSKARRLQALLGPAYAVFGTNSGCLVENGRDQRFLLDMS